MPTPWIPRTLPEPASGAEALVRGDSAAEQEWCNFVLLEPARLPEGLALEARGVRPEAPPSPRRGHEPLRPEWTDSNRSAHRGVYAGRGRRLRIKQFLYDYAPAAFDHPCLWESDRIEPFVSGGHLGWLGTDFRRRRAAAIHADRTMVEVSVLEGDFPADQLVSLCRGLRPSVPEARTRILATPLVDLCYQRRHREPPIAVPVGYWAHKRREESTVSVYRPEEAPAALAGLDRQGLERFGYRLRGLFVFGDPGAPEEVDRVLEHDDDPGRQARLLVSRDGVPGGLPFPPRRETRQACRDRVVEIAGRAVHHAFVDPRYGQHEAVWRADGLVFMLIVKPTGKTSTEWFEAVLREVV